MKYKLTILAGLGALLFMLAAAVLLFTGPRMKQQPFLQPYRSSVPVPPADVVFADYDAITPAAITIPALSPAKLAAAETYYTYYCAFCHGKDGKGNGEVGQSYFPKPADLTNQRIATYDANLLYQSCFIGTGHSPVLERVIPETQRPVLMAYVRQLANDSAR